MKYFTNFKTLRYSFPNSIENVVNIFNRPSITLDYFGNTLKDISIFVDDGISPDRISQEIYESSEYFWFVLLQNKVIDFYQQWPTSYFSWKNDLFKTEGTFTLYTEYRSIPEFIEKGDLVVKANYSGLIRSFDYNNYGVVVDSNSFLRSFDINMLSGNISENDYFYILRKQNDTFYVVDPTAEEKLKSTSNLGIPFTVRRKEYKFDSVSRFKTYFGSNLYRVYTSPYSSISGDTVISPSIDNINDYTESILYKYIYRTLPSSIYVESYLESRQKDWLFAKNIKIINPSQIKKVEKEYYNFVELDEI